MATQLVAIQMNTPSLCVLNAWHLFRAHSILGSFLCSSRHVVVNMAEVTAEMAQVLSLLYSVEVISNGSFPDVVFRVGIARGEDV